MSSPLLFPTEIHLLHKPPLTLITPIFYSPLNFTIVAHFLQWESPLSRNNPITMLIENIS